MVATTRLACLRAPVDEASPASVFAPVGLGFASPRHQSWRCGQDRSLSLGRLRRRTRASKARPLTDPGPGRGSAAIGARRRTVRRPDT
jgi:hypothetical protein